MTIEEIKKLLEGITPLVRGQRLTEKDFDFMAKSPQIIRFLLQRIKELEIWEPSFCTEPNCENKTHALESAQISALRRKIRDLELHYQIAREVWILQVLKDESQMKMTRSLAEQWVDNTIEAEMERLKEKT